MRRRSTSPHAVLRRHRQRDGNVVALAELPVVHDTVEFTLAAVVERRGPYADALLPPSAAADPRWLRPTSTA